MTHKLVVVETAEIDVDGIYGYILQRSPQGAASWYRAFLACAKRIARQPLACGFAAENAEFDVDLRQALFKTRSGSFYRCLYTVIHDEVRILRVRGPGQPPLKSGDVA